jgi:phosphotriesterase-related protein
VASTGYYTSGYRPESFVGASAQQLADGMIREATAGFGATGLRAGIIKIALEDFGAGDRKLCQAAALTHHATGLAITTHVCSPQVRRATLDYLEGAGVPAERIVLGHADDNATLLELLGLVERGCSVLFTIWGIHTKERIGWAYPVLPRHHSAGLVAGLVAEGFGDRVMASIDYWAGFQNGQVTEYRYDTDWTGRDYLYLFGFVVDSLRTMGVPEAAIERMLRDNPRRMLEV